MMVTSFSPSSAGKRKTRGAWVCRKTLWLLFCFGFSSHCRLQRSPFSLLLFLLWKRGHFILWKIRSAKLEGLKHTHTHTKYRDSDGRLGSKSSEVTICQDDFVFFFFCFIKHRDSFARIWSRIFASGAHSLTSFASCCAQCTLHFARARAETNLLAISCK